MDVELLLVVVGAELVPIAAKWPDRDRRVWEEEENKVKKQFFFLYFLLFGWKKNVFMSFSITKLCDEYCSVIFQILRFFKTDQTVRYENIINSVNLFLSDPYSRFSFT